MPQKHRSNSKPKKRADNPRSARQDMRTTPLAKVVVTYGAPVMLLEDAERNTFEFKAGRWVPFALSIVECRRDGLVKELPQKVNKMTRFEVRLPAHS